MASKGKVAPPEAPTGAQAAGIEANQCGTTEAQTEAEVPPTGQEAQLLLEDLGLFMNRTEADMDRLIAIGAILMRFVP